MKISVIINNYNNEDYILDCVDSVIMQSRKPDEIIIVDDGSTDKSINILREYARNHTIIRLLEQHNSGQISAVASGISHATGDIFFFLDGDDCYEKDHLEKIEDRWKMYPHADLIYCRYNAIGDEEIIEKMNVQFGTKDHYIGHINPEVPYDWGYSIALAYYLPEYFIGNVTSTISIKNTLVKNIRIQEYAKDHPFLKPGNPDFYLLLATSLFGGIKVYVPERTVNYRFRIGNVTSSRRLKENAKKQFKWYFNHHLIKSYLFSFDFVNESIFDFLESESLNEDDTKIAHKKLYQIARERANSSNYNHGSISLTGKLAKTEKMLLEMKQSKSWKITAPLRWIDNKLNIIFKK
jgi:glycosyltransferase involved in cell wall biosynthesis